MTTVVLFVAAALLIAAGVILLRLDRRGPTALPERHPEPPPEPGSLFREPREGPR